ncbi:MAG: UPF0182 family protein [Jaaginema sp. PMC 1079.18]|nr:UPF0182 family protein [Jaaginema sp. PMC 1080.18]MEC4850184.1 UPF0182 family protein [Jaaginema sp. PMC 1079.18]MEC4866771.1 UPF0182 family protein [Jaaginema sp. PMC 1078.18]
MKKRSRQQLWQGLAILAGFWLVWEVLVHFLVEILWFSEVDYLANFYLRLRSQIGLWAIASMISTLYLLGNLSIARRLSLIPPPSSPKPKLPSLRESLSPQPSSSPKIRQFAMRLGILLPIVLLLTGIAALMLIHYSEVALELRQPDFDLPNITPPLPSPFDWYALWERLPQIIFKQESFFGGTLVISESLLAMVGVTLWVCVAPQTALVAVALALSLLFGLVLSGNWTRVLLFFQAIRFETSDPIFNNDISFYVYRLPLGQLLYFWLGGLLLYGFIACLLLYLSAGNSLSQGKFPGFTKVQLRHLSGLAAAVMFVQAFHHWIARYELLYSEQGVVYGIGYTERTVGLTVELCFFFLAIAIAVWLTLRMLGRHPNRRVFPKPQLRLVMGFYILALFVGAIALPNIIQSIIVQPNELDRERPYLEYNIAATRQAFALDANNIEVKTFNPQAQLTPASLEDNSLTLDNIRLWDARPLLETNRQLQQLRLYYRFLSADIDRYTLRLSEDGTLNKQQVIVSARELDYTAVPDQARTWVNRHLVYTHGYGFTVSPVNQVGEGGLPNYFVQDIGTEDQEGLLLTDNAYIQQSIPIENPRIYYGELTTNYVMTPSRVPELDFPSGNENVYNTYDGNGGIPIGSFGRRILFADYLKDWQMLFTRNFRPSTRLLFRRDLKHRLRAIAPFLRFDLDPYLVSVDTGDNPEGTTKNYLYWIVDAYTTTDRYPYSDPGEYPFNYTRNSVKIVVDAYNGDVDFYVAQPDDPIIQSWKQIFPNMFKPLETMPPALLAHIRYPEDLLAVQSERLLNYHMTDPKVFYNREDQWQLPQEIYRTEPQTVEPYHLIMRLPTETQEEFILLQPFTPTARPNLIAWLAARSDEPYYGKLLLYQFPKQKLIYGIRQIEALINQDPAISQLISLWDRQGSKALQGNLLVIPIDESILYVEPLYLEAETNGLPTLVRVIVVYDNKIAIAPTLQQALFRLFNNDARSEDLPFLNENLDSPSEENNSPALLRPLDPLTQEEGS